MSDAPKKWFIALIEDGGPTEIIAWDHWVKVAPRERPDNCYLVIARDEMDAYVRALRCEYMHY